MSSCPDLYGWDTAFALSVEDFNWLIAADADTLPRVHPPAPTPATTRLIWRFGAWQIVGAVGSQIQIAMPLAPRSGILLDGLEHPVAGCICQVTAEMVLKPSEQKDKPGQNVLTAATGPRWADIDIDPGTTGLGFDVVAQIETVLTDWFTTPAALALFNAHFDGVSISTALAKGAGAGWLTPLVTGYAGATLPDGGHAIGLLTRTSRNDTIDAQYMLSPYAIPAAAKAGFVIAAPRFFEQLIAPALAKTFGVDATKVADTFTITDDRIFSNTSLTYPLKGDDGKTYNATVDPKNLSMWIDGNELVLSIRNMTFDVGIATIPLETIQITMVERLHAALVSPQSDPSHRVLLLQQSGDPQIQRLEDETLYALGGQLLVDVVIAIVTILIAKFGVSRLTARGLSPIAARVVASLLAVVAQGIGMAITHIPEILATIAEDDLKQMPDFGALLDVALDSMQWKTDARFTLGDVQFADNLQIAVSVQKA